MTHHWPLIVETESPQATKQVAARLAPLCSSGDVILLIGDLGAGKTAFAQGFAAALDVVDPVTSPTFALVRQYRCGPGQAVETLIHADVYRTSSIGEVVELALAELVEERAVALIEWGDMAAPAFGEDVLEVTLEWPVALEEGPLNQRTISVRGRGRWEGRVEAVARALAAPSEGSVR